MLIEEIYNRVYVRTEDGKQQEHGFQIFIDKIIHLEYNDIRKKRR